MGDKTAARRLARELGVPMVPGTVEPVASEAEALARGPRDRLAGDDQGGPGWRRQGHAPRAARGGAGRCAAAGAGRGPGRVRRFRRVPRALRGGAPPHRGPGAGRRPRRRDSPRGARVLDPAATPEAHRGEPIARSSTRRCARAWARRRVAWPAPPATRTRGRSSSSSTPSGDFYFLEVNTRLQVEHPVTEMVTGIDLVREQLRIAAGEPLGLHPGRRQLAGGGPRMPHQRRGSRSRAGSRRRGPSPASAPRRGPWVRDDSGVYEGFTVPRYYDTLMSKLIVWGADRAAAIARMARALGEYQVAGVQTTIPRPRADHRPRGLPGGAHLHGVPGAGASGPVAPRREPPAVAIIAAALWEYERRGRAPAPSLAGRRPPDGAPSRWRLGHPPRLAWAPEIRRARWGDGPVARSSRSTGGDGHYRVVVGDREWRGGCPAGRAGHLLAPDRRRLLRGRRGRSATGRCAVEVAGERYAIDVEEETRHIIRTRSGAAARDGGHTVRAPMPGPDHPRPVAAGDVVAPGDTLVVVEAMKMENELKASAAGTVREVRVQAGQPVNAGRRPRGDRVT